MKKLMFAAALAASLIGYGEVTSANVVGYSTRSITGSTFFLYGVPWQAVDGKFDLNSIVKGLTTTAEIDWDEMLQTGDIEPYIANAPHIQIQKADGGYDLFYYIKNAAYSYDEQTGKIGQAEGWCDLYGYLVGSDFCQVETLGEVTPGASVWFKDLNVDALSKSVPQTVGQVITEEYSITTPAEFRLRAPMLPTVFNIGDSKLVTYTDLNASSVIDWDEMLQTGDIEPYIKNAPHIQIQNEDGGYSLFYYVSNAAVSYDENTGKVGTEPGWCNLYGYKLGSEFCEPGTGDVPVNGAFWANGVSQPFTMTFKPLK